MFDDAYEPKLFAFTPNDIADNHASRRHDGHAVYFDLASGGRDQPKSRCHGFDLKSVGLV